MTYLILFLLIITLIAYKGRYDNVIYWCYGLLLIIIAGLRTASVSVDYNEYLNLYQRIETYPFYSIEPIFRCLCIISPNAKFFFFLYALLAVLLKFYAIKKISSFPKFSVLFYLVHFFFLHEMTQMRIGLASGFVLLMLKELCEHKSKNAFIFYILAVLSHFSTIICLVFFFYRINKISITKYVVLILLSFVVYFTNFSIISYSSNFLLGIYKAKLDTYIMAMQEGMHNYINVFNISFILKLLAVLFFFYLCKFKNKLDKYTILLVKVYSTGLFFYLCFTDIPVFAFRLSEICFIVEIILLPRLVLLFKQNTTIKICLISFAFLWLCLNVYILNLVGPYSINL